MPENTQPPVMFSCPGCKEIKTAIIHEEFACENCGWGLVVIRDRFVQGLYYVAGVSPDEKTISMTSQLGYIGYEHVILQTTPKYPPKPD